MSEANASEFKEDLKNNYFQQMLGIELSSMQMEVPNLDGEVIKKEEVIK